MEKDNPFRIITHINGKPIKKEQAREEFKQLINNNKDFANECQDTEEDFNEWCIIEKEL